MRHARTQEIETERLVLRRLTPEDAGMMYQNWANDPQVTKYLRWEPHKNADETRRTAGRMGTALPQRRLLPVGHCGKGHRTGVRVYQCFHLQLRRTGAGPVARFRPYQRCVGSGLLHRPELVEQRFYHRSPPCAL